MTACSARSQMNLVMVESLCFNEYLLCIRQMSLVMVESLCFSEYFVRRWSWSYFCCAVSDRWSA